MISMATTSRVDDVSATNEMLNPGGACPDAREEERPAPYTPESQPGYYPGIQQTLVPQNTDASVRSDTVAHNAAKLPGHLAELQGQLTSTRKK
ncbi:Hypothetical predicted protein [Pelobates cultripes]|uniref:Uncharacterized protein n=1 Tax=Pelobates cultripes TaxID=61616 RepID=A0AAD1S8W4_PELCU|nr:Hypothetical predicted protein [Pelobates cultripes]